VAMNVGNDIVMLDHFGICFVYLDTTRIVKKRRGGVMRGVYGGRERG
jgi:hypothetical protein